MDLPYCIAFWEKGWRFSEGVHPRVAIPSSPPFHRSHHHGMHPCTVDEQGGGQVLLFFFKFASKLRQGKSRNRFQLCCGRFQLCSVRMPRGNVHGCPRVRCGKAAGRVALAWSRLASRGLPSTMVPPPTPATGACPGDPYVPPPQLRGTVAITQPTTYAVPVVVAPGTVVSFQQPVTFARPLTVAHGRALTTHCPTSFPPGGSPGAEGRGAAHHRGTPPAQVLGAGGGGRGDAWKARRC